MEEERFWARPTSTKVGTELAKVGTELTKVGTELDGASVTLSNSRDLVVSPVSRQSELRTSWVGFKKTPVYCYIV